GGAFGLPLLTLPASLVAGFCGVGQVQEIAERTRHGIGFAVGQAADLALQRAAVAVLALAAGFPGGGAAFLAPGLGGGGVARATELASPSARRRIWRSSVRPSRSWPSRRNFTAARRSFSITS